MCLQRDLGYLGPAWLYIQLIKSPEEVTHTCCSNGIWAASWFIVKFPHWLLMIQKNGSLALQNGLRLNCQYGKFSVDTVPATPSTALALPAPTPSVIARLLILSALPCSKLSPSKDIKYIRSK